MVNPLPAARRRLKLLCGVLAAAFVALTVAVLARWTEALDVRVALALAPVEVDAGPLLPVLAGASIVGGAVPGLLLAVLMAARLWLSRRDVNSMAPLLLLVAIAVELLFKSVVPQPDSASLLVHHPLAYAPVELPAMIPFGPPYAFPSGHAARLAFLAGLLVYFAPAKVAALPARRLLGLGAGAVVTVSAAARAYSGEHWLTDVVGGLLLGACLALVAVLLLASGGRPEDRGGAFSGKRRGGRGSAPRRG